MSRRAREEPPFGSDSFLDVLANIVGILIILIVAAAARMGRAPVPAGSSQNAPEPAVATSTTLPPVVEPEPDEPPPEISEEMRAIAEKMAALEKKSLAADAKLQKLHSDIASAGEGVSDEDRNVAQQSQKVREAQLRIARLEETLGERQQSLTGLLAEFEEAKASRPPAVEVRHRLAPISQDVSGDEVHFRLSGGRVSVVPLQDLVDRVKRQLERQRDWLASRGRHEAIVGPVDGYTMHYLIERKPLSNLDRARLGYGGYRIGVKHCEILPEPDLLGETAEEALRRGSKFALSVKIAPPRAAITFWVYPDSFHAFRILQAACQAEGFIVAGRPLPDGQPIGVAEDGSRSAGQ